MYTLDDENAAQHDIEMQYVEAGVIDEDQITQWQQVDPQDISWLPEE